MPTTSRHLAALLALVAVSACQGDGFTETGYFKDAQSNRVFALVAPDGATTETVEAKAAGLAHTGGQFTQAVIYEAGATNAPGSELTGAANYVAAVEVVFAPAATGWRWRWIAPPQGEARLIDCRAELCTTSP